MSSKQIQVRAKAFAGHGVQTVRARVDGDGTIRVYDDVAGHYTTCHSLGKAAKARIRKLAEAA